jgi:tRNA(fMet)-specific endonuclease VapC
LGIGDRGSGIGDRDVESGFQPEGRRHHGGALKRGSKRLTRQVDAVLGAHDVLIAAHARHVRATCVTANIAEFRRVPALDVENWLA